MVAGATNGTHTYIYRDPETVLKQHAGSNTLLPAIVLNLTHPESVQFSDSDQFLAVQSGHHFAVYDADSDRRFYYDIPLPILAGQRATWMDGNRLTLVSNNKVIVFDYDGLNRQTLVASNVHFMPYFSGDYKKLYTFTTSLTVPGRAAIIRTDLVAK
jgi:hypothetical protein